MNALSCSCACGAATFSATPTDMTAGACHCGTCRKWSGGVLISTDCGANLSYADESAFTVWNSSDWAERLSCATCGSTLIWRTKDRKSNQVSVQAFETPEDFAFDHEIFVDSKPSSYAFANDTKKMTGAEVFAMFAAQPEEKA